MKRCTERRRQRDITRIIQQRRLGKRYYIRDSRRKRKYKDEVTGQTKKYIDYLISRNLNIQISASGRATIYLPEIMNLSKEYENTMPYLNAIRAFSKLPWRKNSYHLVSVNFDHLKKISSSAALLLTAELSRWDDSIRNMLKPSIDNWNDEILEKFYYLGFFDLFKRSGIKSIGEDGKSDVRIVKYVKGNKENKDYQSLKKQLFEVVGEKIKKWTFLHSGLDEAITNVGHHAYPESSRVKLKDKNWYITGAFNKATKELKVVFFDQGIGIPRSLPTSKIWEQVLSFMSFLNYANKLKDATLLRAAMEVDRTRTGEVDRGKG